MSLHARISNTLIKTSREKKLHHFYSLFKEGETVLDVGVSRATRWRRQTSNLFMKTYRYDPSTYTGLAIEDMSGMEMLYPGKRFVRYPGGAFPFGDNEFNWVFSNAVIEHVGDFDAQLLFLNEMLRVGYKVFFTTPNKYFPVESHTSLLFLHWHDNWFRKWRIKNAARITQSSIDLLSKHDLKNLLSHSTASSYNIYSNRFLGLPMTFTVVCE
jgi:hypothetical protein